MKIKTWLVVLLFSVVAIPSALVVRSRHDASVRAASRPAAGGDAVDARNPDGSFKYTNRLIREQSPYLLQHAHNPVDWYPWGPEAFAKARRENKPIFLSVGYSTCHWCHVMERESFSQPDVASVLNARFVAIKVDREERPDVDDVYMTAVQLLTGSGGWPETTLLLSDGRPFYGGTYLPKADLLRLLAGAAAAYQKQRPQVVGEAARVTVQMKQAAAAQDRGVGPLTAALPPESVREAVASLQDGYDAARGGFGGAPKFPPHASLALLLSPAEQDDPRARAMALGTLDAMARGGIRDHLGGGFHRYSTDADWKLPHFEKMLYDNALLGESYAHAYALTHDVAYKDVADGIYGWVAREMTDPQGGFYSALDADAGGVEGGTYVWTRREIRDALGPQDGPLFARVYNVQDSGNYDDQAIGQPTGKNVLFLTKPLAGIAQNEGEAPAAFEAHLAALRARLLAAREKRVQPRRDDKVIAGWNGLMIGSLARAGKAFGEPEDTRMAQKAAAFATGTLMGPGGTLRRDWRAGRLGPPAFQDDYAYLADGLLDLADATGDRRWAADARRLTDRMVAQFWDPKNGGFFEDGGQSGLLVRLKEPYDNALPSGNAVAVRVLARLGRRTGDAKYAAKARATIAAFQGTLQRSPAAVQTLALAAGDALGKPSATATSPASVAAAPSPGTEKVRVRVTSGPLRVRAGKQARVTLTLTMTSGWHINSATPSEPSLIPTRVTLGRGNVGAALDGAVLYPQASEVMLGGSRLSVYEGAVHFTVPLVVGASARPGPGAIFLRVAYQPCSDRVCLPPETQEVRLPVTVTHAGGPTRP